MVAAARLSVAVPTGYRGRMYEADLDRGVLTWVVTGEVRLLVDRAVGELVAWGKKRCGPPQFNLNTFHASESGASEALAAARTLPMMAGLRVVVLKDLEQGDDGLFGALVGYLEEPSPSTLFVASGAGFPKVRKGGSNWAVRVANAVKKKGGRQLSFGGGDVRPVAFVREHATSLGKRIADRDADMLVALVGADLGRLACEIEKLALYVGDAPDIDGPAISAASSLLAEAVAWDLTGAIARRDANAAVQALHRLLEGGDASHRLLALVVWQLRTVVQVAEERAKGKNAWAIREAVGGRKDDVDRILHALGDRTVDAAALLAKLARANRMMNSHRAGDRHVFEGLVLELCA